DLLATRNADATDHIPLLNLIHDVHPVDDAAEHGVLRIEMRLRRVRDEELTAAGVGPGVERHADGAAQVRVLVELVTNGLPRSTFAVAPRITGLHHEIGNNAMHAEAIEESAASEAEKTVDSER